MDKEELLELETRREIHDLIRDRPGIHFRAIKRELGQPTGALEYHLHTMEEQDLITSREGDRYKRFYVTGELDRRDKDVIGLLRQDRPREILTFLLLNPLSTHKRILANFDIAPSTLSFHLSKLQDADLVTARPVGRQTEYDVADEERIARLLIQYRASFVDEAVDQFAETWLNLNPEMDVGLGGEGEEE